MACFIPPGSGWYTNKCGRCVNASQATAGMDECGDCIASGGLRRECPGCGEERDACGVCRRRNDTEWNSCR